MKRFTLLTIAAIVLAIAGCGDIPRDKDGFRLKHTVQDRISVAGWGGRPDRFYFYIVGYEDGHQHIGFKVEVSREMFYSYLKDDRWTGGVKDAEVEPCIPSN